MYMRCGGSSLRFLCRANGHVILYSEITTSKLNSLYFICTLSFTVRVVIVIRTMDFMSSIDYVYFVPAKSARWQHALTRGGSHTLVGGRVILGLFVKPIC